MSVPRCSPDDGAGEWNDGVDVAVVKQIMEGGLELELQEMERDLATLRRDQIQRIVEHGPTDRLALAMEDYLRLFEATIHSERRRQAERRGVRHR